MSLDQDMVALQAAGVESGRLSSRGCDGTRGSSRSREAKLGSRCAARASLSLLFADQIHRSLTRRWLDW